MLQDGNGVNAVIIFAGRNLLNIRIHVAHARNMRAIFQSSRNGSTASYVQRFRQIGNVIQVARADLQNIAAVQSLRYLPMHPRLELNPIFDSPCLPRAIGSVVLHIAFPMLGR